MCDYFCMSGKNLEKNFFINVSNFKPCSNYCVSCGKLDRLTNFQTKGPDVDFELPQYDIYPYP